MHYLVVFILWIFFIVVTFYFFIFPLYMMYVCFKSSLGVRAKYLWLTFMFFAAESTPIYGIFVSKKKLLIWLSAGNIIVIGAFAVLALLSKPEYKTDSVKLIYATQEELKNIDMHELSQIDKEEVQGALITFARELEWEKISKKRKEVYFGVFKILDTFLADKKLTKTEYFIWIQYAKYRHFLLINTLFMDMCHIQLNIEKRLQNTFSPIF